MKSLFIADIHANKYALKAVLQHSTTQKIDQIYCLGDISGYFEGTSEVISLLKTYDVKCIKGNHDGFISGQAQINNKKAYYEAYLSTLKKLTNQEKNWISSLPNQLILKEKGHITNLYHGGPNDLLNEYTYPSKIKSSYFEWNGANFFLFAHTHLQFGIGINNKLFLNPGSVGLPRNGDYRAHFLTIDFENIDVTPYRISYDINKMIDDCLYSKAIHPTYLHNLIFGRTSTKPLSAHTIDQSYLQEFITLNPNIYIINTKFGLILEIECIQNNANIIYIAFYQDNTVEISSSTLVFHWQLDLNLTEMNAINLEKDSAGYYYLAKYEKNDFNKNIKANISLALEIVSKFKIKNVKI
ncbi:hypothetical protein GM921_10490 [Pedobacter sp. LMG 31464]|uniref:Calcineurin-like phosphoesterase domain-containing protein n=1 Tax=Pedobacter planticolens TaxID=2679964 RepID=A0A923DZG9_9SPHI|nr:metallophosphoesterase family protein [Pedobacter planticolens]MBB2145916.1 hypothetical protein [Pedobacter planticolens]